ncbi:MAG: polysaccharide biosynthesis C-terminal domain-containing protein, partial [bacterium]
ISGIIASGGYLPFQLIFNQLGFPGLQSFFLFAYVMTNLILNIILVPLWGMYGSAIATALALLLQIFYLKILLKRKIQIVI